MKVGWIAVRGVVAVCLCLAASSCSGSEDRGLGPERDAPKTTEADAHQFADIDPRNLRGSWRPVEVYGKKSPAEFAYGYLNVGDEWLNTVRGCAEYRGRPTWGPGGRLYLHVQTRQIGCPVDVRPPFGPNTVKVLQNAVHVQLRSGRLSFYDEDRDRIGVYLRVIGDG